MNGLYSGMQTKEKLKDNVLYVCVSTLYYGMMPQQVKSQLQKGFSSHSQTMVTTIMHSWILFKFKAHANRSLEKLFEGNELTNLSTC